MHIDFCTEFYYIPEDYEFICVPDEIYLSYKSCGIIIDLRFLKPMKISLGLIARFIVFGNPVVGVGEVDLDRKIISDKG